MFDKIWEIPMTELFNFEGKKIVYICLSYYLYATKVNDKRFIVLMWRRCATRHDLHNNGKTHVECLRWTALLLRIEVAHSAANESISRYESLVVNDRRRTTVYRLCMDDWLQTQEMPLIVRSGNFRWVCLAAFTKRYEESSSAIYTQWKWHRPIHKSLNLPIYIIYRQSARGKKKKRYVCIKNCSTK